MLGKESLGRGCRFCCELVICKCFPFHIMKWTPFLDFRRIFQLGSMHFRGRVMIFVQHYFSTPSSKYGICIWDCFFLKMDITVACLVFGMKEYEFQSFAFKSSFIYLKWNKNLHGNEVSTALAELLINGFWDLNERGKWTCSFYTT